MDDKLSGEETKSKPATDKVKDSRVETIPVKDKVAVNDIDLTATNINKNIGSSEEQIKATEALVDLLVLSEATSEPGTDKEAIDEGAGETTHREKETSLVIDEPVINEDFIDIETNKIKQNLTGENSPNTSRKKKLWFTLSLLALLLMGVVISQGDHILDIFFNKATANEAQAAIAALYYDDKRTYLSENIDSKKLGKVQRMVNHLSRQADPQAKALVKQYEDLSLRYEIQTKVNDLFDDTYSGVPLKGNRLNKWNVIKDETDSANITVLERKYERQLMNRQDGLYVTLSQLIEEAKQQVNDILAFKMQLAAITQEGLMGDALTARLRQLAASLEDKSNPFLRAHCLKLIGNIDTALMGEIEEAEIEAAKRKGANDQEVSQIEDTYHNQIRQPNPPAQPTPDESERPEASDPAPDPAPAPSPAPEPDPDRPSSYEPIIDTGNNSEE